MRDGKYGELEKINGQWINHGVFKEDEPMLIMLKNLDKFDVTEQEVFDMDYISVVAEVEKSLKKRKLTIDFYRGVM